MKIYQKFTRVINQIFTNFLALERSKHLSFKAKYTLWSGKINELYNAGNQNRAFDKKFIPFTDPDTNKNKYLSRNHLTPHADFVLAQHQTLTYYFHNCFPGTKR